uniref:Gem-associated protein 5 n=1 Tax=Heliothis virescens TaxID=7102 RepID=A0A2A4JTS7_HELVI
MDETVLLPSPNWFLVSTLAVSSDGWLIYGGPTKSLCVLEPRKADEGVIAGNEKYQAYVVPRAHAERIVTVNISPEWLEKRTFLTGSQDGVVKQWVLETVNNRIKIKAQNINDVHLAEQEDVVGVGYSSSTMAISVGGFSNIVKWDLSSNVTTVYTNLVKGLKPSCMACSPHLPLHVAVGTKQGVIFLLDLTEKGRTLYKVRSQDEEVANLSWCPQYEVTVKKTFKETRSFLTNRLAAIRNEGKNETNVLDQSGIGKTLPDDSFDDSIVQEDDTFDIYADHEPEEFGHKKYVPEDIVVKVKKEKAVDEDYLAECFKLRMEILRMKNQTEPSIESLVDALDNTHVETDNVADTEVESAQTQAESNEASTSTAQCDNTDTKVSNESSHYHKHLLASVSKYGGVRIWSKSGQLVSSSTVTSSQKSNKKGPVAATILWYKADTLLIVDPKSQLMETNPLQIDSKNKLACHLVHQLHKRGMYCIVTNAPRIQTETTVPSDDWSVWSASQDRNIIRYCLKSKKALAVHSTCGGFLYTVLSCPYDAGKVAVSVGDGTVRVLEMATLPDDDTKLSVSSAVSYWQNVQGKVLTIAWHPTRENLLAFATAEARVGLLDTGGRHERPGRVLHPGLSKAVYSLSWGDGMQLYASGGGALVVYNASNVDEAPEQIKVNIEGQSWQVCAACWSARGLLVGSQAGAVALLAPHAPHTLVAAAFVFTKMIHAMEWHPQQTSSSSDLSPYKDLIAVTSLAKESNIIILEYGTKEDGTKQLTTWKTLVGHKNPVLQVAWNPHRDGLLVSSSQDATVRVWEMSSGSCISIFGGHAQASLGVSWVSEPQLPHHVLTGGADACLRVWDIYQHKAEEYEELKHEVHTKTKRKKETTNQPEPDTTSTEPENVATKIDINTKTAKPPKKFLLPIMYKQIHDPCKIMAPRKMLQMFLEKTERRGEKGDGIDNVNEEKINTVDEKGDSNKVKEGDSPVKDPESSSVADEEGDGIKNISAEETVKTEVEVEGFKNTEVEEKKGKTIKKSKQFNLDFLKIFGSIRDVNEFLDLEMASHLEGNYHPEAWIMLSIFRGHIDTMIQFASKRDMLCPFLLSMAPCVSFKYWKDATHLYLAQIDRIVAKGEEDKLYDNRHYGGSKYRKAAILLSMHDVMGAVKALCDGKLFKEAYILCRIRYMDSVAAEVLRKWATDLAQSGNMTMAAVCYIALDDLSQAAQVLARSHDQESLSLAAEIAKIAGRTTFADQVEKKAKESKSQTSEQTEEILKELPSKIELLMKEDKAQNGDTLNGDNSNSDILNGDH